MYQTLLIFLNAKPQIIKPMDIAYSKLITTPLTERYLIAH